MGMGLRMPRDVSWPDRSDPGALPLKDFRNLRFKLIPLITEGPMVVKTAVRSQPAILGQKVALRHFRGPGYVETDVHVGSSFLASQIVSVCRGHGKQFSADVGIVLQAETAEELPERLLGCASFNRIDINLRRKLD